MKRLGIAVLISVFAAGSMSVQETKPVPRFAHAPGCPKKCKTCEAAIAKALGYLAEKQQSDGSWEAGNGGTVVVTSLAALAFLAQGSTPTSGPYAAHIEKAAGFLLHAVTPDQKSKGKTASGQEFDGFGNWDLGFAALFLGEYAQHARVPALTEKMKWLVTTIREGRESNGGWGHAKNFAYRDLVVASVACMAGLGSMKLAGVAVPPEVIEAGVKYFEDSSEGNVVGYSPRPGQKGWGKAGRASGVVYAMYKLGATTKFFDRVARYVLQNVKTIPEDHASPTLHYLFGGLVSYLLRGKAWDQYVGNFRDLWLGAQQEDGSFVCPTESDVKKSLGMDVDAMVGPAWPTAVFCIVFQLPYDRTSLVRNQPKKPAKGAEGTPTASAPTKEPAPTPTPSSAPPSSKPPSAARPWLGICGNHAGVGLAVMKVKEESPAAAAGLQQGDLVVEFEGKAFEDVQGFRNLLRDCRPGRKSKITYLRSGARSTVEIVVGERPGDAGKSGVGEEL